MPYCDKHNWYSPLDCSMCYHDLAREEKAAKKAEAKRKALLSKPKKVYAPPNKVSDKQRTAIQEYNTERLKWLPGKMCVVFPKEIATTVHHAKGRIGYADNEARLKGITLLMDKRYWIPASPEGHRWIEEHPQEAKDRGWSQSRLENLDQEERTI